MPSDRTRRPSASVLMISMVLPPEPVTTSPGLIALPDGMFSVVGTMPMTLILGLSSAIASMAPTTAAPPPMSDFILYCIDTNRTDTDPGYGHELTSRTVVVCLVNDLPREDVLEHDPLGAAPPQVGVLAPRRHFFGQHERDSAVAPPAQGSAGGL